MGYYSDRPSNKKGGGWLLPIIIGLAVGILLMLVISPNFTGKNVVLDENEQNEQNEQETETTEEGIREHVNVDVSTQITEIVDNVSPAVVGVTNIQSRSDFWQQGEASEAGTGSGVIYKKEGGYAYIVTNHHVVEGADMLEVVLNDDTNLEAELLGSDLFTD